MEREKKDWETLWKKLCAEHDKNQLGKTMAMKYMYCYQDVIISLYFDGFDRDLPLVMLILKYQMETCYWYCNTREMDRVSMEENKVTPTIQRQLCKEKGVKGFLEKMWEELNGGEYVVRNYKADLPFKEMQMKEFEEEGIYPFFGTIETGSMSEEYLELLYKRFPLPFELLKKLQKENRTIRTVSKYKERKTLGRELARCGF